MSGRLARLLVVLTAVLGARVAGAQARLTGTVRDTVGNPLAGVEVSVQGITRTATSDRAGGFTFAGLPAGTASVTFRRVGYAPQTTVLKFVDGDNPLGVIVLTAVPRELDTVTTREQELWREFPLLREFDENRKIGLGQFVTRQQLAMHQGGFMSPVFNQMRGIMMIRSSRIGSHAWIANAYVPTTSCTILQDKGSDEATTPVNDASCHYCYPAVYMDNHPMAPQGVAANVGQFNPDQFEAIQVFLGDAEVPAKYMSRSSGCGVIIFISRVPPRRVATAALRQDHPTRSRAYVNAAVSSGTSGASAGCTPCGSGTASDFRAGYTFRDRWVVGARLANWSGNLDGQQSIKLRHVLLEWYPHPDPGKLKWFLNTALGSMAVDLYSEKSAEQSNHLVGSGLPSAAIGTGVDISLVQRLVFTPFLTYNRSMGGLVDHTTCIRHIPTGSTTWQTDCFLAQSQPRTFTLLQLGTRLGWR